MMLFTPSGRHRVLLLPFLIICVLVLSSLFLLTTKYFWLAVVPSIAIMAILLLGKRPQLGTYLLIVFIPFGAFKKLTIGTTSINITWIIAALLLLTLIIQTLVSKGSFSRIKMSLWPWLFFLMLASVISTWLSPYQDAASKSLLLWLAAMIFMSIALMTISKKDFFDRLPSLLIASVFASSFLGNLDFFTSITMFSREQVSGIFSRNLGGANDANNLSLMVIACLPLVIHRLTYAKSALKKLLYFVVLANSVLAIGTSYSRGGMLVFMIAVLLILIEFRHTYQPKHLGFMLLGISIGLTVFVQLMPDTFWERQSTIVDWSDSSLKRRTAYLYVAKDALMQNPIFGTGPDTFYQIFAETSFARLDKATGLPLGRYAHNTYIEVLIGTGIVGLTLFLLIIFKALKKFSQIRSMYVRDNQPKLAHLIGSYRLLLVNVMIYLAIFSETHHKFMLLGLVLSQLASRYYQETSKDTLNE